MRLRIVCKAPPPLSPPDPRFVRIVLLPGFPECEVLAVDDDGAHRIEGITAITWSVRAGELATASFECAGVELDAEAIVSEDVALESPTPSSESSSPKERDTAAHGDGRERKTAAADDGVRGHQGASEAVRGHGWACTCQTCRDVRDAQRTTEARPVAKSIRPPWNVEAELGHLEALGRLERDLERETELDRMTKHLVPKLGFYAPELLPEKIRAALESAWRRGAEAERKR